MLRKGQSIVLNIEVGVYHKLFEHLERLQSVKD